MTGTPLIRFNHVMRDAVQSLLGTSPSAEEILTGYAHAHEIGTATIQTGGGTFFDIFAKKGRNEWEQVEKIAKHFQEHGIRQTALIRGDCLFGYKPYSYDAVKATVEEYAKLGINELQNFHGLNDVRVLEGVAKATQEMRDKGYDIIARGAICIEDNPNITIQSCLETADALLKTGHKGFYLKSASGAVKPEFVRELVGELSKRYPDESIDVHIHSTYGQAPISYMTAIEAALENNHPIGIDVQHPAMAGNTAHPSMLKMHSLIANHPNQVISEAAPNLNMKAIQADIESLYDMRFRYRNSEARYNPELLDAMRGARAPGGATATLKDVPNLIQNLEIFLGQKLNRKPSWDDIQIAVYQMQAKILPRLGQPTQVTPYAFNTTQQAAMSLVQELQGRDPFAVLTANTKAYLAGQLGRVPEGVDPELQQRALKELGLDKVEDYVPSPLRKDEMLPAAVDKLKTLGIEEPTQRQAISAVMLRNGHDHVVACANGTNKPDGRPAPPVYMQPATKTTNHIQHRGPDQTVQALGGPAKLEQVAQWALFHRQLSDDLNPFPAGVEHKKDEWLGKLTAKLKTFVEAIPDKLGAAGLRGFIDQGYSDMARGYRLLEVETILRDVLDHRAPGNFDHVMEEIGTNPTLHKAFARVLTRGGDDPEGPTGQLA